MSDLVDYLGTAENWWGRQGIVRAIYDHVRLSGLATLIAVVIALPPAVVLGHARRGGFLAVSVVNIGRAMPSFAILALVFPLSLQWGFGLGFWPTAVALVLLAVPPIFTNTYTGVRDVDPGVVGAATGMGMSARQVLARVEVPNAVPLIVTGVRIAAVQVVATATLGALVGFGGLGALITAGYFQQNAGRLQTGALFVALLAIVTEVAFGALERRLTPWTGRRRQRSHLSVAEPDPASAFTTTTTTT